MVCPSCYQDYISNCPVSLSINAGLTLDTEYVAWLVDKFGMNYEIDFTADGDGIGVLDLSTLPDGLFTPYSGFFTLKVLDDSAVIQDLTINGTTYNCIEFEVKGGDFTKTYLGEFVEEAASS